MRPRPLLPVAALLSLTTLLHVSPANADDALVLDVSGALPRSGGMKLSDLEAMGPIKAEWTSHGAKHEVFGVPLERVLTRFGFDVGPMSKDVPVREKRKGWRMAILASAPDGFQAVFSCAEVFESMGATRVLLVWKEDGKALPAGRGPLRLVVLTDKEPSRSVQAVRKLEVLDLRGVPAAASTGKAAPAPQ
jgi:hypothetical protein